MSKVIEKLTYKNVLSFLSKSKVLFPQQYSFQTNISNIHAISELLTATYEYDNTYADNYTGIMFLDLAKPLDTVCY